MTITARYSGTCPECGDHWQPGDSIDTVEPGNLSRWKHAACPDDPADSLLRRGEQACATCWLVHPEGACDR